MSSVADLPVPSGIYWVINPYYDINSFVHLLVSSGSQTSPELELGSEKKNSTNFFNSSVLVPFSAPELEHAQMGFTKIYQNKVLCFIIIWVWMVAIVLTFWRNIN